MGAVELAAAYISIVPSMKGAEGKLTRELAKEFSGLEAVASREGSKAGEAFGNSLADKAKDIAAGAGTAASLALGAGFANDLNIDKGTDKLAAQLGLTGDESKRAGKLAAGLYTGAYGDSLGQVNEAVASVSRNVSAFTATSATDMERLTAKTLDLSTAFDQDLARTTAAAGQLVKTGLARDADEAFDVITVGFQKGVDKSGDFLDTLNEYSTQFRNLGLDATTATGLLSQGLQGGARDADQVADGLKEFSLRIVDTTKTAGALGSLGFTPGQAKSIAGDFAVGGASATKVLDDVLDRIRALKDPAAQTAAVVELFGTQAEDAGKALLSLDPTTAVAGLGQVEGAADRLGTTLADNTGSKIDSFKRKFELATSSIGGAVGPLGAILPAAGGLVTTFGAFDGEKIASGLGSMVGKAGDLASGLGSAAASAAKFAATQATAAINVARTTGALVAQKVASVAQAIATKAAAVAQGIFNAVMNLNPIFLIVLAVVAFIAILVLAYTKVEFFRNFVDAAFRLVLGVVQSVVGWVRDNWPLLLAILTGPIGLAVLFITRNWDSIKAGFESVVGFIGEKVGAVIGFFVNLHERGVAIVGGLWGGLKDGFSAVVNFYRDRINDVIGFVVGLKDGIERVFTEIFGVFDRFNLFEAGKKIVQGLIDGIKSMFGVLGDTAKGLINKVTDWLPGSPAKTGPLSGQGYSLHRGAALTTDFAAGMLSEAGLVKEAARIIAASAGIMPDSMLAQVKAMFPTFFGDEADATAWMANYKEPHAAGSILAEDGSWVNPNFYGGSRVLTAASAEPVLPLANGGGAGGFSVGDVNVTTRRDEETARDVVLRLRNMAYLAGR